MTKSPELLPTLKRVFGYDSFRSQQEEIMGDALAGRDVFALLPTGGGKSLCYQLPALLMEGLTVVVSPLIALMKDQVDQLTANGVAATYLNSSLVGDEGRTRLRGLHRGEFKLLYVAPERLMLSGFLEDLEKWNVRLIAVDEAHCISEWGHDFRPEYRQLANLRGRFPGVPMMALTATATGRVREDIVRHLRLEDPGIYVASFNRPNLNYRVIAKAQPYDQLASFVRTRQRECGIVYCSSRKATESVAERLRADGIKAQPYHAGLPPEERAGNQEKFLRDEVRVICATIAFGMGINKPNVRYVVHYDLPKNVEGYYQETGRAGRDGLPSDCLLLFSAGDVAKQTAFIDEKPNPEEQRIAREQLQTMVHYAESAACRRLELLGYFGETWTETNCGACDNCLTPRELFDGTVPAQKFLSCVIRVRQSSGFGFGLNHIIDVLLGSQSEMVRKRGHDQLSTFGIGGELKKTQWQAVGRELVRLGLLTQSTEKFATVSISAAGQLALKERRTIMLTKLTEAREPAAKRRAGDIPCDEALFERLRFLRKSLADEREVPAYIIFSDATLREMARRYPATVGEFGKVPGVGQQKLAEYGEPFVAEIVEFLRSNPRQNFGELPEASPVRVYRLGAGGSEPRAAAEGSRLNDSSSESLRLFRAGRSPAEIAAQRGFAESTIFAHLAAAIEAGETVEVERLVSLELQREIEAIFEQNGQATFAEVREKLGERVNSGQIRVFLTARGA